MAATLQRGRRGRSRILALLAALGALATASADVDGTLFFSASDGASGRELWQSDGTLAGTVRVHDIAPGAADAAPTELEYNGSGLLFFSADDGTSGVELCRVRPNLAVTQRADILPGPASSSPADLVVYDADGELYFSANDGVHGRELWKGAVTPALLADLQPGPESSTPSGRRAAATACSTPGRPATTATARAPTAVAPSARTSTRCA